MHNGCILCGGVGVGKSHTAVGYYLKNEAPKNVYVITTAKKRDKQDWQFLWGDVGMTGDPETTMGALVIVDSWENIKKYEEISDAFFVFDEQRLVGTGAWVKAFYKIAAANRWIMLSATPGDNWLDYVPVFRANGLIKNITAFKEDHVVSRWTGRYYQVTGYRQVPRLVRWRNQLLVDMPYEKHTTRHTHEVAVDYDKDLVKELVTKRWHVYDERPLTDASELFRVMRKVVYSDKSRLTAVRSLLKSHPKLIVFYNFDYELEMLRGLAHQNPQDPECLSMSGNNPSEKESSRLGSPEPSTSTPRSSEATSQTQVCTAKDATPGENDPWMYLLSPEGMRENSNILLSKPRNSAECSDEVALIPGSTDERTWEGATGIPTNHPNAPWNLLESPRTTSNDSSMSGLSATGSGDGSTSSSTRGTESSETETTSCSYPRGSEEWQTKSQPARTDESKMSGGTLVTETTNASVGRLSDSPRKSTSSLLSTTSRSTSDLSTSGSDSSSRPQFQVAEWNGHKHEEVPTTTSWVYLVQYVAGAEAWECTDTDAMVFYSMPYSYKTWWQAHGRIDRLNTSFLDLHYYVLFSGSVIDQAVRASLKAKKSFNESAFRQKMGF